MSIKLKIEHPDESTNRVVVAERVFNEPIISIGSHAAATLRLAGHRLAPEQALILQAGDQFFLINRADGTMLNGDLLPSHARQLLRHQDRIRVGDYLIEVVLVESPDELLRQENEAVAAHLNGRRNHGSGVPAATVPLAAAGNTEVIDQPKSFSAILDGLRTIEDSFYFVIRGGEQSGRRIPIRDAEMLIGWDESFQTLRFDPTKIATPCARVRKDWSGVLIEPQGEAGIMINRAPLGTTRRLRDSDEVALGALVGEEAIENIVLVFHEPASLIVLDTLLPNRLPPVSRPPAAQGNPAEAEAPPPLPASASAPASEKRYLGYFSAIELLMMAVGTLILAAIVFLLLESF